jgi:EAL domain-containing protein (putative c-di-GMP-specific phosphodiesterase class I)
MNFHGRKMSEKSEYDESFFITAQLKINSNALGYKKDCYDELSISGLHEVLNNGTIGVEYQPIVEIETFEIYGYESLARFYDSSNQAVPPDVVFASLHHFPELLFLQEFIHKQLQLAKAPLEKMCFINLDKDSFFAFQGQLSENPFLKLFSQYKNYIIVELTENTKKIDALGNQRVISILNEHNITTAIDDALKPNSIFSFEVLPLVKFIKLDKFIVERTNRENQDLLTYVAGVIDYAHQKNKKLVLEGIETADDLAFARKLGVDYVQGFYFRDKFINFHERDKN